MYDVHHRGLIKSFFIFKLFSVKKEVASCLKKCLPHIHK